MPTSRYVMYFGYLATTFRSFATSAIYVSYIVLLRKKETPPSGPSFLSFKIKGKKTYLPTFPSLIYVYSISGTLNHSDWYDLVGRG